MEYPEDNRPGNSIQYSPKNALIFFLCSSINLSNVLKQNKEREQQSKRESMAMKACFRLSTPSTETSAFRSHHHLIFSKKKQPANPTFFLYPHPKSFHSESTKKKKQNHFFIFRAKNIVDEVLDVTDETWKEHVIDSEIPVIVQFWAPSCGPCKLVEPVVGDLIKEYAGKVVFYKINTDECLKMASQYGVRSIPTVLLFKDGKQKECITGAVQQSSLTTILEKYL